MDRSSQALVTEIKGTANRAFTTYYRDALRGAGS
jgi:hypothetical protein